MERTRKPVSARARIVGAVLAVACVGLAVVGSVTFVVQQKRTFSDIDQRLHAQVASLQTVASAGATGQSSSGAATPGDPLNIKNYPSVDAYLKAAVALLVPAQNEASVAVLDGQARYRPETLSGFDISHDTALIKRVIVETRNMDAAVIGTARTSQGSLRYIAIPVTMKGDPERGIYIRAVDLDGELAPVTASAATYALAALVMLVAIGTVGWFVVGRLLSPIRHLRDTADAITLADLGARIPEQGNDDISDMTRTVNSMLDRLEGSVDVQRQLLDDVRHELKTPITIVRGHLELMDPADPDDVQATREIGIAELDRMTRLVEDIDALASLEGPEDLTITEVDVANLTRRAGDLIGVIPGHTWAVATAYDGVVAGDSDRLLQAWLQLADNAAKYTPEGSPIEIGSDADTTHVRLWMRDHGPGIPPAARHRVFRRFDRAGGSRGVSGSGLGLAIVDAIARAHGGSVAVTDTPGGGATITIHLPLRTEHLPSPVRAGDVLMQREAVE
ncbi:MAG TPA: HAMP domain-containing sensor histidine kinase [Microbacterium sp.]|nr:HAMP domain-containing sensor histidine kinase [Microbacterium sp.]